MYERVSCSLAASAVDAEAGWCRQPVGHMVAICGRADEEETGTRTPGCGLGKLSREQQSRLDEVAWNEKLIEQG